MASTWRRPRGRLWWLWHKVSMRLPAWNTVGWIMAVLVVGFWITVAILLLVMGDGFIEWVFGPPGQ